MMEGEMDTRTQTPFVLRTGHGEGFGWFVYREDAHGFAEALTIACGFATQEDARDYIDWTLSQWLAREEGERE
jgi:hypothetical protein